MYIYDFYIFCEIYTLRLTYYDNHAIHSNAWSYMNARAATIWLYCI